MKSLLLGIVLLTFHSMLSSRANPVDFKEVRALVPASEEETIWRDQIDWKTDLWQARQLAGKLGKSIFIWEMDGHPMGCT